MTVISFIVKSYLTIVSVDNLELWPSEQIYENVTEGFVNFLDSA